MQCNARHHSAQNIQHSHLYFGKLKIKIPHRKHNDKHSFYMNIKFGITV